jgi:hypothetical protein
MSEPHYQTGTAIASSHSADARQSDGGSAFDQFSPRSPVRGLGDPLIELLTFFFCGSELQSAHSIPTFNSIRQRIECHRACVEPAFRGLSRTIALDRVGRPLSRKCGTFLNPQLKRQQLDEIDDQLPSRWNISLHLSSGEPSRVPPKNVESERTSTGSSCLVGVVAEILQRLRMTVTFQTITDGWKSKIKAEPSPQSF